MSGLGLAGMDRKAMEQERLARTRKRPRSISPPPKREDTSSPKIETTTTQLPSGARLMSFSTHVNEEQRGRKSGSANAASQQLKAPKNEVKVEADAGVDVPVKPGPSHLAKLQYPHGVVKKTWAFGYDRAGDDVKLEEVLEARTLRTAVLSAFQWDTEWVLSKLKTPQNGGQTKCVFVMQAKEDALRDQMIEDTKEVRSFLRLCFPSMVGQINCMHSKLMLLFHPDKLRIAIPTANLLPFDWGESGVMENSVFMIDLPRKDEVGSRTTAIPNDFCLDLLYFMEKQGMDEDIRRSVSQNFDFSATNQMRFIHTVGGMNTGNDAIRTGLPGLSQAVRRLNIHSDDGLQIDFAASSIGSLNDDQLRSLHSAARGQNMFKETNDASSKPKSAFFKSPTSNNAQSKASNTSSSTNIRNKIRIYFPTHPTVRASKAGAAGTICLSRKWWEEMRFPRACFRDYTSTRTGLLSHNKILYARGTQTGGGGGGKKSIAWAYVGSANFSESAWGKVVFDKKKGWKVNCRNWECGVLLPVSEERIEECVQVRGGKTVVKKEGEDSETESEDEGPTTTSKMNDLVGMEVFDQIVRPPFTVPGDPYEDREPWFFQEYR